MAEIRDQRVRRTHKRWHPPTIKLRTHKKMTTEPQYSDTPQKADCPSAPCSPSDYDAGLLNDFGGGDIGWWQDYLRAEVGRANEYWREIHDQQNALMVMPSNP